MSNWRGAAQVELEHPAGPQQQVLLTPQQVDQLLKLLPQSSISSSSGTKLNSETNEELNMNFAGNVTVLSSAYSYHTWILDTGATDHIAMDVSLFLQLRKPSSYCSVSLPNA